MAKCECLVTCPFFNDKMKNMQGMANIYKNKYCLGDNSACARYMVFKALGSGTVPSDLFPNMHDRAKALIAKK